MYNKVGDKFSKKFCLKNIYIGWRLMYNIGQKMEELDKRNSCEKTEPFLSFPQILMKLQWLRYA